MRGCEGRVRIWGLRYNTSSLSFGWGDVEFDTVAIVTVTVADMIIEVLSIILRRILILVSSR